MAPTIILIRHAQALHNVARDWSLPDPPLTELGRQQCAELQESLKASSIANEVELIITSAMRRTLETTTLGLDWLIKEKNVQVLPDAGWQENSDKPCDTGSAITVMELEFPQYDFSAMDPLYPDKTTSALDANPYVFTKKAVLARGQACLKKLYSRPEKVIVAVSHSGFLRTAVANRRFANADWRVFDFDEEKMAESKSQGEGLDGQGLFILKEWDETMAKGGGLGRSEKGVFYHRPTDFPAEVEEEVTEEIPA
ncbi:phosphoglycerate mutase-like protein [Polyplosphaeria fusca]|uniref:Phosphoglycerate mutase-like protein n=1 Tax=Polyplosphaeria fusca TaxID=682080 RepID=A0A9P4R6Q7_9PLEO|nr:phosphoglycerate mutase-like protein [Polyplosphaeria fusca]